MDMTLMTLLIFVGVSVVGGLGTWAFIKAISDADPYREDTEHLDATHGH
ncbi:MAG: hypothetical protein U0Z75_09275 [Deinococcaceae bacterium]